MQKKMLSIATGGAVAVALVLGSVAGAAAEPGGAVAEDGGSASPVAAETLQPAKKLSANALSNRAHKAGLKEAGWSSNRTSNWGDYFKASKSQKWWVQVKAKTRSLDGSPSQTAVTKYRSAVISTLKSAGLKKRGSAKARNSRTQAYANSRTACAVRFTVSSQYSSSGGASVTCTTVKKVKRAVKKAKPFADAYKRSAQSGSLTHVGFGAPKVKKSASKKYRKYQKGTIGITPVLGVGGFSGHFAKAPGKNWTFAVGVQGLQSCSTWEKSKTASRAWVGEACVRGTYPNGKMSRVRAR